jgi:fructose transport system ATP-binding protein
MSGPKPDVLQARGLLKRHGQVIALDGADLDLREGEILAVVGDNGAGKTSLIKCLSGASVPDAGEILLRGRPVRLRTPAEARRAGIECCYQDLAIVPALTVAENLFLGREIRRPGLAGRWLRMLDKRRMAAIAEARLEELNIRMGAMTQRVETLSGGQRQSVAVARAAMFAGDVVILDEPTAALVVRESCRVLDLILRVRDQGRAVILISHNMPQVFEIADRIHVARLGQRVAVLNPKRIGMSDTVAVMTGAIPPERLATDWLA